ncbi:MAG: aspartate kinase, partial [Candidatus Dormibacteraeota bacterium]|nr:aspartate kinase [Candidatus Dormibacteraeota bacterium]
VVAGFQGATAELDVTTLGRGGSDTTAVALAVALHAESCDILTDVAGVHTADPRLVPQARVIAEIGFGEMLELAACGAAVMHPRAVEIGEAYDLPIRVRSAFERTAGTLICKHPTMEQRQKVRGIAQQTDVAKVTMVRVPDRPGIAATIFGELASEHVDVDIVLQNVGHDGSTDISFTIPESDMRRARHVLQRIADTVGAQEFLATADIAKVSVVGTGLRGTPGVLARICETLAADGINIEMIASSEIHVTCIIDRTRTTDAVRALHRAFELERI